MERFAEKEERIRYLEQELIQAGIHLEEGQIHQLETYYQMLVEKNKVMNLTAITAFEDVVQKHFIDSMMLLRYADLKGKKVIDVGTGAGFPGLPLKLLVPSLRLTLLDSLGKRIAWLESVCTALGLEGVTCLHARAEEQALVPGFRDSFDLAVSRAVAPMALLSELCLPYVRVGGRFLAMKSVECGPEVSAAAHGIQRLGGRLLPGVDYTIPGTTVIHRVVPVEKEAPTPKGLPRRWAKIQKSPL